MAQARYALNKNKYLLDHEYTHFQDVLERFYESDTRNSLLLSLLLKTGARAQEALNIKKQDLNPSDQSVLIHGIKGSNDREIPLEPKFFKRLWDYSLQQDSQFIFDISYSRLRQVWDQYRPCAKKIHSLRHTFAIRLYKKTKDIRLVQVALGHRNIMNTMIYADYVYSQQELRKLIL